MQTIITIIKDNLSSYELGIPADEYLNNLAIKTASTFNSEVARKLAININMESTALDQHRSRAELTGL